METVMESNEVMVTEADMDGINNSLNAALTTVRNVSLEAP